MVGVAKMPIHYAVLPELSGMLLNHNNTFCFIVIICQRNNCINYNINTLL